MQKEKNRTRKIKREFYISDKEDEMIKIKMSQLGMKNFSHYARKMLIDGYVINLKSSTQLQQLIYEINKIGVNVNQLTKLANENQNISKGIINQIVRKQEELSDLVTKKVAKIFGNN